MAAVRPPIPAPMMAILARSVTAAPLALRLSLTNVVRQSPTRYLGGEGGAHMARKAGDGEQRRVQSIEVGFRVVRALQAAAGPQPLRAIAAAAGMPASKAHLYLVSFVREGMAYQDEATGHYGLGRFAIDLGLAAIRQLDVVDLAREELRRLRGETDC